MKNSVIDTAATTFLNVQVTAIPHLDANGKVTYATTFTPRSLTVTEPDTVINYQLIDPTPVDVKFKGLSVRPDNSQQFSKPSISESGRLVTFSDANTIAEKFNISIKFTAKDNQEFLVDPEVENDPRAMVVAALAADLERDPEPENDPRA
ncbi:hypothetical protein [Pseudoduganella violaceinigra]|uniref:hypothetical protein n=1 Tax=Pseudoduganella violaceinigra TaxID=246602 RepID=UPI0012B51460|nr:hypothetical protein [Pseudoduganella violaceinigra]